MQQIIIPSLLILHLNVFSEQTGKDHVRDVWLTAISPWSWFIRNSTPLFTIMEGFCSLIFFQTVGRLFLWLVRTKGDSWIIGQLLASSCVFSTGMYFLYRIYTFPVVVSLASASLIGAVLTATVFVALYGIVSAKGNPIESSLVFAYIVYCLYFTFTDFQSTISASNLLYFFSSSKADVPPLPPFFVNGWTSLVSNLAGLVPAGFNTVFQFVHGAVSTVTPSVFVSLAYRLGVYFAATRIVPAVHQVSHSRTTSVASLQELNDAAVAAAAAHAATEKRSNKEAMDEDDEVIEDDDDATVIPAEELDVTLLDEKLSRLSPVDSGETATGAMSPSQLPRPRRSNSKPRSKIHTIQFLIFAYAPCILIAVYTHLLLRHVTLFNATAVGAQDASKSAPAFLAIVTHFLPNLSSSGTSSAASIADPVWTLASGWVSPRAAWQFWGWINMLTTLTLYTVELVYGQKTNRDDVIVEHWNSD